MIYPIVVMLWDILWIQVLYKGLDWNFWAALFVGVFAGSASFPLLFMLLALVGSIFQKKSQ